MRIMVTGAAGTLGSVTCRHLLDAGHAVVPVDREPCMGADAPQRPIDLRQPGAVDPLVAGCDAVVHLASHTSEAGASSPQQTYIDNVTMNANVFQAASDAGVAHLLYASSVQIFAGDRYAPAAQRASCLPYLPLDGQEPPCPGNAYAASKEAGEALLRYHASRNPGMTCTSVRWPQLADEKRMAFYRTYRPADGPAAGSMLDVGFSVLALQDAADFIQAVVEQPMPGYHQWLPASEQNRLGWPAARLCEQFYPDVPLRKPAESLDALVDLTPIRERFDWRPRHSQLADRVV
ncbi:MAG: NAD(P)-dependent oxidoreductase [Phycisphaeraceae bacterium]